MPAAQPRFTPGNLVRARGREWIVLQGSDAETLKLRPVSGSEEDQVLLHLPLELEPVREATFPLPSASQVGSQESALLLRDALLLTLRRGAGPFRSFGQIAVEPRAYQLVPLLMALRQDPVRLLVADDVGVGKTIEAALIARELLDRGEIERTAVLCPPHLVEQWTGELEHRFNIRTVAVTAAGASRLERGLPMGESIFTTHRHTVVSLDYIKNPRRRDEFLRACPGFVIVDEAHTCASTGAGRHQRYELLKGLAADPARHVVLLTATPHSGDEDAFYRLLGLLDARFEGLKDATGPHREAIREALSRHFVQRRRPDIAEWKEGSLFPRRQTAELTYRLSGEWERFFEAVLDYCSSVIEAAGGDERRRRLSFWGTLALMRCVASSPAAGVQALRTRARIDTAADGEEEDALEQRLFDGAADALPEDDVEPPARLEDGPLADLVAQAEALAGQAGDPKLKLLTDHLAQLLEEGYNPVVFSRYIATAHYLGRHLRERFPDVKVDVVTGDLTADERKERVEDPGEAGSSRLLLATDCLSEGVNLQEHFDAVVHYDLSWNPTRHEQREGRVDRFGQRSEVVRATLIYGANNPVDGAVLEVILRKAEKIREQLGVPVPLPDDGHTLTQALMKAVLLRHAGPRRQRTFEFAALDEAKALEVRWQDAAEKAKASRTVFAQRRLKPEDVLPEWRKTLAAMGGTEDVRRFTGRSLARLGSGLEELKRGACKVALGGLPEDVQERLEAEGVADTVHVSFGYPPAPRTRPVQRSHPLVSVLAESLLERTLGNGSHGNGAADPGILGRTGCWISERVTDRTTVALLRLRHQLTAQRGGRTSTLLVEEAAALAWTGARAPVLVEGLDAFALLAHDAADDPKEHVAARQIAGALELAQARRAELDAFARRRAEALLEDHKAVRKAGEATGRYSVTALLPADVIGLYVLLPKVS
jgi:superfamily II DNA or RNA helicase